MEGNLNRMYKFILDYGLHVIAAVLIFVLGHWVAKMVVRVLEQVMLRAKVNKTLVVFAQNLVFYGIMTFVIIATLNKLGVETGSFIAVVGAVSLAIGLAFQGSLSNFASGVLIILLRQFRVDDVIETGGIKGRVQEIQIFNTVLVTEDLKHVIIPNSKVTGDKIIVYPVHPPPAPVKD